MSLEFREGLMAYHHEEARKPRAELVPSKSAGPRTLSFHKFCEIHPNPDRRH